MSSSVEVVALLEEISAKLSEAIELLRMSGLRGGERDEVVPVRGVAEADKPAAPGRGNQDGCDQAGEGECESCGAPGPLTGGWCLSCAWKQDQDLHAEGCRCLNGLCRECPKTIEPGKKIPSVTEQLKDETMFCPECGDIQPANVWGHCLECLLYSGEVD